jgi:hypothetical protein
MTYIIEDAYKASHDLDFAKSDLRSLRGRLLDLLAQTTDPPTDIHIQDVDAAIEDVHKAKIRLEWVIKNLQPEA